MDDILINFIQENIFTLGLFLAVLKEIAKATPWAVDDKIIQLLSGLLPTKPSTKL